MTGVKDQSSGDVKRFLIGWWFSVEWEGEADLHSCQQVAYAVCIAGCNSALGKNISCDHVMSLHLSRVNEAFYNDARWLMRFMFSTVVSVAMCFDHVESSSL